MATTHKHNKPNPTTTLHVVDWDGPLPAYITWLHDCAIREHSADEYPTSHLVGFRITPEDVDWCDSLKDITMVYLSYKEDKIHGAPLSL